MGRRRETVGRPKLNPYQCGQCGQPYMGRAGSSFCSWSCAGRARNGPKSPNWKGGKEARNQRYRDSGKAAAQKRDWYAKNREKEGQRFREVSRKRKAQMGQRLPRGTVASIGEQQGWLCVHCRIDIRTRYHMDHIIPLSRGGPHLATNIQLLCPRCNLSKGSKLASQSGSAAE